MLTCPCNEDHLTPPLSYSKNGVYRGILIFALKHRSWVLVRTASLNVLSKNKKNITIFHKENIIFTAFKILCIMHGHVCVMDLQFIRRFFFYFLVYGSSYPNFCILEKN